MNKKSCGRWFTKVKMRMWPCIVWWLILDKTPGNNNWHSPSILTTAMMLPTLLPLTILVLCNNSAQLLNKYRSRSGIFLLTHGVHHTDSDNSALSRRFLRGKKQHKRKQWKHKNKKRKSWNIKKKQRVIIRNYQQNPRIHYSCTCGITADLVQVCREIESMLVLDILCRE